MKKDIKIFVSTHKPTDYIHGDIFQPIKVGAALHGEIFPDFIGDNTGDNISEMNPRFCELTAQYWAWKNDSSDYCGFFHYRRYLDLNQSERHHESPWGLVEEATINSKTARRFGLTTGNVEDCLKDADIIVPERLNILKMPFEDARNMRDQFLDSGFLHAKDLEIMEAVVAEKYPDFVPYVQKFLNGHISCFCNMFIMKRALFDKYCEWLFDILFECDKRINYENYSTEAMRTPGHLAERLLNIYLLYLEDKSNAKIKEVPMVTFSNTDPSPVLEPAFKKNNVPVVFAANNDFVPVFAVCLQSIIEAASPQNNYDLVLIQSDISMENRKVLENMLDGHGNISLRFFDAEHLLNGRELKANEHISTETYYRFLIQEAMPSYDKVLYIDCDLIVKDDLAELYNTDISGYMLAAAHDPDFTGQVGGADIETMQYAKKVLRLKNPFNYFQAGVILFNEREMKKAHSLEEWLDFASNEYKYSDQDILNRYCEGRVKFLDMSWNTLTDCNHERVEQVIRHAPAKIQEEYQAARKRPRIIHYAGFMKPWYNPNEDFGMDFWALARQTPFYESLLYKMSHDDVTKMGIRVADYVSGRRKLQRRAHALVNKVLPKGSGRRKLVKRVLKRSGTI